MKKIEEEYKYTLVQLKEAKCEVEGIKEELVNAYSKIKFLELEIIQANVKVKRISTKKLDSLLSFQKSSNDKANLGYTDEGSSSSEPKKEVMFESAKNIEKSKVEKPKIETHVVAKRTIGTRPKEKGKSLPKSQKGPQVRHFCHCCGVRGHTRPNCFKLQALKRADSFRGQDTSKRMPKGIQAKGEMRDNSLEMLQRC